jgi:hypothetical protein
VQIELDWRKRIGVEINRRARSRGTSRPREAISSDHQSSYYVNSPMKTALSILLLIFLAISYCMAQQSGGFASTSSGLYELYSWQQPNGGWNFCLLPSPSGVNIPAEVVFSDKARLHGVKDLDRKISELPPKSSILWMDRLSGTGPETKESYKLACPPRKIIEHVKRHAKKYHMDLDLHSCGPSTVFSPG